eukprot:COSAG05_NODE_1857_length_3950_cov_11.680083_1_plen_100_part_00
MIITPSYSMVKKILCTVRYGEVWGILYAPHTVEYQIYRGEATDSARLLAQCVIVPHTVEGYPGRRQQQAARRRGVEISEGMSAPSTRAKMAIDIISDTV